MEIADIKSMQPSERLGIRGRGENPRHLIAYIALRNQKE
jgi:hypothetical protein